MKLLTVEQHAKRIQNMKNADQKVQKCLRKERIHDYIPGHVTYHMGDYPARFDMAPTEYDYNVLKKLAEDGFQWIKFHTDCIDWLRRFGGDTFMNGDWEGTGKFIDLAHQFGHKMIPYISPTYFPTFDPEFREDFTELKRAYVGVWIYLCSGNLGSPTWREYNYRKTFEVLDRLPWDGVFGDFGYDKFLRRNAWEWDHYGNADNSHYAPLDYDPEVEDYLGMIYSEVKRRGLTYKLHLGCYQPIPVKEKVYDYLAVGEGGRSERDLLMCKEYPTFVVPGFDRNTNKSKDLDFEYAITIPYLQFPSLYYGRPMATQNRRNLEGVTYYKAEDNGDAAREWYLAHPNGPYVYSEWSAIPDDPMIYEKAKKYLALYKPMVAEDSVVRVEITETSMITSPILEDIIVSLYTNEEQYMVVSNISNKDYTLTLSDEWEDRETGKSGREFIVPSRRMIFLKQK